MNGVSVVVDETAREVSERQVLPAEGLRERIEQQRPITALRWTILPLKTCNRPIWLIGIARASVLGSWELREFLGLAPTNAAIGVLSVSGWPCGHNSQPVKPECHQRRDPRHEARGQGLLVLTAGPVPDSFRCYPTVRWSRPSSLNARGSSPLSAPRRQQRDGRPKGP